MTSTAKPLVIVEGLTKRFRAGGSLLGQMFNGLAPREVRAVENVSFSIERGRTFAIVGESGCGKSTIARCLAGIERPTAGRITLRGLDMDDAPSRKALRGQLQMIFQDPYASLDPRWRVRDIIAEPIVTHQLEPTAHARSARVDDLLGRVGLVAEDGSKFPHQFSGGQRQRISIARALASRPAFLICDEPTSALDVSVQAQVLNLMRRLQRELGVAYLLISHNLAVVAHMADRIAVMYLGRIVEQGPAATIMRQPAHPYTRLLLETVPSISARRGRRERRPLDGEVPSPLAPPPGCTFHPRCPLANARCRSEVPAETLLDDGHRVQCHAVVENRLPPRNATIEAKGE